MFFRWGWIMFYWLWHFISGMVTWVACWAWFSQTKPVVLYCDDKSLFKFPIIRCFMSGLNISKLIVILSVITSKMEPLLQLTFSPSNRLLICLWKLLGLYSIMLGCSRWMSRIYYVIQMQPMFHPRIYYLRRRGRMGEYVLNILVFRCVCRIYMLLSVSRYSLL